ncbi:hypothetical protein SAMD00023353_0204120 [Rosellinia necatrix]|uniref:RING-type domain-containing protein n=1 Tax=Rosellinia necatrix TaxID=77044 RepID=A0A1W2TP24_ROSNE|nr:hypothetical protein SAMD00023353_0204120 [Rosellinia necatrix]
MPGQYSNQIQDWMGIMIVGDRIVASCELCDNELSTHDPASSHDGTEVFTILPCGHCYGYHCLRRELQGDPDPRCPVCGMPAGHGEYGHQVRLEVLRQEDY